MSLESSSTLSLNEAQQRTLLGPNGKTIQELIKEHDVSITLPSSPSQDVLIVGKRHKQASRAIKMLVDPPTAKSSSPPPVLLNYHSGYTYLKYRLVPNVSQLDEKTVKNWLSDRLESFLGAVGGGSLDVDVLIVNVAESSFLLRAPSHSLSSIQAAIILAPDYNDKPVSVELVTSSTSLTAMAAPDRNVSLDSFSADPME